MAKKTPDVWAPQFGCWSETAGYPPPAGCSVLGLFLVEGFPGMQIVRLCTAYYYSGRKRVSPDESQHDAIRWFVSGPDGQEQEVSDPFAWAEARWVIPLGNAWNKARGLPKEK